MPDPQTTLWFAELDGEPLFGGFPTREAAIADAVRDYKQRDWRSLRKAGYTVAKYKLVKVKP